MNTAQSNLIERLYFEMYDMLLIYARNSLDEDSLAEEAVQETFHFSAWEGDEPNSSSNLPYASLQEAIEKAKIEEKLVPTWIPEGYQLVNIIVEETPTQYIYYAIYRNEEKIIKISVRDYLDTDPQYIEHSEGLVEVYERSGVVYYLIQNYDNSRAEWITHSYECYISGDMTIEQLKLMIDSIEKG